jgi:hypothetical protein
MFVSKIAESKNRTASLRDLMRKMKLNAADFGQVVMTRVRQGEIEPTTIQSAARKTQGYNAGGEYKDLPPL